MMTITHPKIKGFLPVWAPFRGFSLLFDNPGSNVLPTGPSGKLEAIHCRPDEPALRFYYALWNRSKDFEQMLRAYLFCPLPFHSYHVTVWDGLNAGNVRKVAEQHRIAAEALLQSLPDSLLEASPFYRTAQGDPIGITLEHGIEFVFDRIEKWNNSGLVARIKPANERSERALRSIEEQRSLLIDAYRQRFGIVTTTEEYRPHVSLGYFANKELAELSTASVEALNDQMKQQMNGLTVQFSSISLYGMTDMETFFKVRDNNS